MYKIMLTDIVEDFMWPPSQFLQWLRRYIWGIHKEGISHLGGWWSLTLGLATPVCGVGRAGGEGLWVWRVLLSAQWQCYIPNTFFVLRAPSTSARKRSKNSDPRNTCNQGPWAAYGCLSSANVPCTPAHTNVIATSPAKLLNVKWRPCFSLPLYTSYVLLWQQQPVSTYLLIWHTWWPEEAIWLPPHWTSAAPVPGMLFSAALHLWGRPPPL